MVILTLNDNYIAIINHTNLEGNIISYLPLRQCADQVTLLNLVINTC